MHPKHTPGLTCLCRAPPPPCRDALFLGDCDDGVRQLCRLLDWEADLDALIAAGRQSFHPAYAAPAEGPPQPGVAVYQ